MSDRKTNGIRLRGVGKMYRVFNSPRHSLLDTVGLGRILEWRGVRPREFWSLRDVNLEIEPGSRLGIIGRNGAGKSTLLRLITGVLAPTEGEIELEGEVQALFDASSGFHPEFTGLENIRASLTYYGLDRKEIESAITEIAEFTELGNFLQQPLKTYSLGMQARLAFATATSRRPDILIVDEVLGAGDAYFASKSTERMRQMVEQSGATVLLVSHALDQITRYCDECVWIERGRVVRRGPSMEVVNAYEGFIHDLEDRRLTASNKRRRNRGTSTADEHDSLICELRAGEGVALDIGEITLLQPDRPEEKVAVGDVQDSDPGHPASILLDGGQWSEPRQGEGTTFRRLFSRQAHSIGFARFSSFEEFSPHSQIRLRYSLPNGAASIRVSRGGIDVVPGTTLEVTGEGKWTQVNFPLAIGESSESSIESLVVAADSSAPIRWAGEGSLVFEGGRIAGPDGRDKSVFRYGDALQLVAGLRAHRSGNFNLIVAATIQRSDGVVVTHIASPTFEISVKEMELLPLRLELAPVILGNGRFFLSLSAFDTTIEDHTRFDLLARAYEFNIVGNDAIHAPAVFRHSGVWQLE